MRSACWARPTASTRTRCTPTAASWPPRPHELSAQLGSVPDEQETARMIRFDKATKRYPDGTVAVDELELEAPSGKITVLVGPSGLRQDHVAADDQPDDRADLRHDLARRHRHREHAGPRAAASDRLRHPARRPVPAPHHRGQHRDRAVPARAPTRSRPGRARWSCSSGSASTPRSPSAIPAQLSGGQQQRVGSPGRWPPTRR